MRNNEERILGTRTQENSSAASNSLSFVIPTEYVDLPSKGKFYPVGHPLHNKNSIEIKQMTAKEEDILTSDSYIRKGVTLEKLLESIIIDKSIDPDSICLIDKSAILVAARISGYGPEYKATVQCSKCSENVKIVYDLVTGPSVEIKDENLAITENGTFAITLPKSGWVVECKILNGSDEKASLSDENKENVISNQLLSIIYSIQGDKNRDTIKKALEAMTAKDSRFLRNTYKELIPKYKFAFNLDCKKCGNKEVLEVPVTLEFFWPEQ